MSVSCQSCVASIDLGSITWYCSVVSTYCVQYYLVLFCSICILCFASPLLNCTARSRYCVVVQYVGSCQSFVAMYCPAFLVQPVAETKYSIKSDFVHVPVQFACFNVYCFALCAIGWCSFELAL